MTVLLIKHELGLPPREKNNLPSALQKKNRASQNNRILFSAANTVVRESLASRQICRSSSSQGFIQLRERAFQKRALKLSQVPDSSPNAGGVIITAKLISLEYANASYLGIIKLILSKTGHLACQGVRCK